MPKFKPNTSAFRMQSPVKTKLGRWLMGRKKHVTSEGETVIVDKHQRVVKSKKDGVTTKYKKGSRPHAVVMKYGGDKTKVQYNK